MLVKKFIHIIFFTLFFICCNQQAKDKSIKEYAFAEKMAYSIMKNNDVLWKTENDTLIEWDYKIGLLGLAFERLYEATSREEYFEYIKGYYSSIIDEHGQILGYNKEDYNIDLINPGKVLFFLADKTNDSRYKLALNTLRNQIKTHPRTPSGGFWHKKIYPNQMWLDGLYMGAPFYAQYNTLYEKGDQLHDISHQFKLIYTKTHDSKTGLLYHGWDESKKMAWANPQSGKSPNFWSRSIGWYMMALVDVLDFYPEDHTNKADLIEILTYLSESVTKYQHSSGLWFQVTDQGNRTGNYLEASGSCMFTYALAKASRKGYISEDYMANAVKGFNGIIENVISFDNEGLMHINQICGSAGLGGNPYRDGSFTYYINEKIKTDNLHGLGPFILAAVELKL